MPIFVIEIVLVLKDSDWNWQKNQSEWKQLFSMEPGSGWTTTNEY